MLRAGVVRGVVRGVELAERIPVGLDNWRLTKFSFSSGTAFGEYGTLEWKFQESILE